jgi:hypothetical protein
LQSPPDFQLRPAEMAIFPQQARSFGEISLKPPDKIYFAGLEDFAEN